jgi:hypothetical protein
MLRIIRLALDKFKLLGGFKSLRRLRPNTFLNMIGY